MNNEADAIKESILNSEVVRYRVSGIYDGLPTINVLVRETKSQGPSETETLEPEKPEESSGTESE